MITLLARPVKGPVSDKMAVLDETIRRKILRVPATEQHTLVVKQGTRMVCLRFTEQVTGTELIAYCHGQLGWKELEKLEVVVNGARHKADHAAHILIQPETERVEFNNPQRTVDTMEFTRRAPQVDIVEFTRRAPQKG